MRSISVPTAFVMLAFCTSARATCADSFTMLESVEMRAEHAHGVATMLQGPMALLLGDAANNVGERTSFRSDTLIVWTEPANNKAMIVFVTDCGSSGALTFSTKAFAAVLATAYPRRKTEWQPL